MIVSMPKELAGFGVVGVEPWIGIDNQFEAVPDRHEKRSGVRPQFLAAIDFPHLFASAPIQGEQVGGGVVITK